MKTPRRNRQRFRRRVQPAELPGTIRSPSGSLDTLVRLVQYGRASHSDIVIEKVEELPAKRSPADVTWVNVVGLGNGSVVERIGRHFNLHPLALEDVVNVHQRPKVEMYSDYLFVVVRGLIDKTGAESQQISMFLGRDFVVTFQERQATFIDDIRKRLASGQGKILEMRACYLLYTLIDGVIDAYFPALEVHGEKLDSLDDFISSTAERDAIHKIHEIRAELLMIRRAVWPLRDALNTLIRDSGDLISDETDLYLRDSYDHTIQIIDVIETDRELCSDLRDYYLTVVSNRMNQVMKFLTIIATFFMPLTFVAGLYGMNFNTRTSPYNMPELNWRYGYPFALTLMASAAIAMLFFFRKKRWLT